MASITKTKNGKFKATVYVGRDANGKQIRKSITCDTEKEAKRKARELEQEIEEGKFINIKNMRLSKWMDEWLELNKNILAPSTYVLYKDYIRAHYKPDLGNYKLSQLNEIIIRRFMNKKLKILAQNTVRKLMYVLNRILEDAMKNKNPMKDIEVPTKQKTRFRLITEEEFQIIHEEAKKDIFDECIILLAAWGGLRRGEIFALEPSDFNYKECSVNVNKALSLSSEGAYVTKRPKSENGFREVALPEYLINLISKYCKKKRKIEKRLFNMRPDNYTHRFKRLLGRTSLAGEDIVFHDLRHYHASWLYRNNIPDLYSADRLGHDVVTMKKIYQHMDDKIKKEMDNKIIKMTH